MNQEELKQRLIDLIEQPMPMMCGTVTYGEMRMPEYQARFIVNNLIANGVTIRERGEWKDNTFCSRCGYFAEDDEGHILMSFDEFCPFCGADMRGVKDE